MTEKMQSFEEIQRNWKSGTGYMDSEIIDKEKWQNILKQRVKQQKNITMQYFWASLTFQIIIYGFLTHVMVKYSQDIYVLLPGAFCLLLYVPYTTVLIRKYKRMAVLKQNEKYASSLSIKEYITTQHTLLEGFYKFKITYELVLVPLSSAVFVWIFFKLYMPGGVLVYPIGSSLLFIAILAACMAAIIAENKRNFRRPLQQLEEILKDINAS